MNILSKNSRFLIIASFKVFYRIHWCHFNWMLHLLTEYKITCGKRMQMLSLWVYKHTHAQAGTCFVWKFVMKLNFDKLNATKLHHNDFKWISCLWKYAQHPEDMNLCCRILIKTMQMVHILSETYSEKNLHVLNSPTIYCWKFIRFPRYCRLSRKITFVLYIQNDRIHFYLILYTFKTRIVYALYFSGYFCFVLFWNWFNVNTWNSFTNVWGFKSHEITKYRMLLFFGSV